MPIYTLEYLKQEAEEIVGAWNGDNPGTQEDRAHVANQLLEKITEIEALISELHI